jgi:hypothetical protein
VEVEVVCSCLVWRVVEEVDDDDDDDDAEADMVALSPLLPSSLISLISLPSATGVAADTCLDPGALPGPKRKASSLRARLRLPWGPWEAVRWRMGTSRRGEVAKRKPKGWEEEAEAEVEVEVETEVACIDDEDPDVDANAVTRGDTSAPRPSRGEAISARWTLLGLLASSWEAAEAGLQGAPRPRAEDLEREAKTAAEWRG